MSPPSSPSPSPSPSSSLSPSPSHYRWNEQEEESDDDEWVNVEIKEFLYRNFFTARRRRAEGGTVHCEVRCMVCGRSGSFVHPQAVHYYEHMLMCFNSSDAKKIL
jgi:hypothetical protein